MKKLFKTTLAALLITLAPIGCNTPAGQALKVLPDIANFTIQAVSTWVAGASTLISIASSTLGAGTFSVNYSLTGANILSNATATLTVNGTTGTFPTQTMSNSGQTNIIINSITSSSGTSDFSSPPSYTFADSVGLMTGTLIGSAYRSTYVKATLAGTLLTIHAVNWTPLTTITLTIENYTGATGVTTFTVPADFTGGAQYSISTPASGQIADHGTITLNTTSPLMTGSFQFTNPDNSTATGTFSCPHP